MKAMLRSKIANARLIVLVAVLLPGLGIAETGASPTRGSLGTLGWILRTFLSAGQADSSSTGSPVVRLQRVLEQLPPETRINIPESARAHLHLLNLDSTMTADRLNRLLFHSYFSLKSRAGADTRKVIDLCQPDDIADFLDAVQAKLPVHDGAREEVADRPSRPSHPADDSGITSTTVPETTRPASADGIASHDFTAGPRTPRVETHRPIASADKPASEEVLSTWLHGERAAGKAPTVGDEAWWKAAFELLDRWQHDDDWGAGKARHFLSGLEGRAKELFAKLLEAHFVDDAEKLRNWAYDAKDADLKEASGREVHHRLQDPNVVLVQRLFHVRPELAMIYADDLVKAKSDADAGDIFGVHLGLIGNYYRAALYRATALSPEEIVAKKLNPRLIARLHRLADVSLQMTLKDRWRPAGETRLPEDQLTKAFRDSYQITLDENRQFWTVAARAASGDSAARQEITRHPGIYREQMSDIAGNLPDALGRVILGRSQGEQDRDGNWRTPYRAKNLEFGDQNQLQWLELGKTWEENNAALLAFMRGGNANRNELKTDAGVENRLQLFESALGNKDLNEPAPHFFADSGSVHGGIPALELLDDSRRPAGVKLASVPLDSTVSVSASISEPKVSHAQAAASETTRDSSMADSSSRTGTQAGALPRRRFGRSGNSTDPQATPGPRDEGTTSDEPATRAKTATSTKVHPDQIKLDEQDRRKLSQVIGLCAHCHAEKSSNTRAKRSYLMTADKLVSRTGLRDIADAIEYSEMPKDRQGDAAKHIPPFLDTQEGKALLGWLRSKSRTAE